MILLTGAAGKTGKAILRSLSLRGVRARALVRSHDQADEIKNIGNPEIAIGDLRDEGSLSEAIKGIDSLYYICPNISPDELEIGNRLIHLAKKNSVKRFLYHSVLHPQIEAMPHHWQKMRVEECLFSSGLDFTIIQPCAYMQNILTGWSRIQNDGQYIVPYSIQARISIVDLEDVGDAIANVLTQNSHSNAIYELAGPEPITQVDVARHLSEKLKRQVKAVEQSQLDWATNSRKNNMQEQQIAVLLKMFIYYDKNGLVGNPSILEHLLERKPTNFDQFLVRTISSGGRN